MRHPNYSNNGVKSNEMKQLCETKMLLSEVRCCWMSDGVLVRSVIKEITFPPNFHPLHHQYLYQQLLQPKTMGCLIPIVVQLTWEGSSSSIS